MRSVLRFATGTHSCNGLKGIFSRMKARTWGLQRRWLQTKTDNQMAAHSSSGADGWEADSSDSDKKGFEDGSCSLGVGVGNFSDPCRDAELLPPPGAHAVHGQ